MAEPQESDAIYAELIAASLKALADVEPADESRPQVRRCWNCGDPTGLRCCEWGRDR